MNVNLKQQHKSREGLFGAISAGFFFVLIGFIFVYFSFVNEVNLFNLIVDFFGDFKLVQVSNIEYFNLPAPSSVNSHSVLYSATALFSFIWGFFQIIILAIRFSVGSTLNKKAETISNIIVWLGVSYLVNSYLIIFSSWFEFWAIFVMLIGVSLIARAGIFGLSKHYF